MRRLVLPFALGCALAPAALQAQVEVGRYQVSALVGMQEYAASSALERAPVAGVEASYYLSPHLSLGLYGQVARPRTDPLFFPLVRLNFGAVTEYHAPAQRVTAYALGAQARMSLPLERVEPYATVGAGAYLFNLDPEQNRSDEFRTGPSLSVGAGVNVPLTPRAGVRMELRDNILLRYDRDWFDLSDPLFREPRHPAPGGEPPDPQSTIHNLRWSLGFTFIPGAPR
jgi:hypothetical protein